MNINEVQCWRCPVMEYRISRQMIELFPSGEIYTYHLKKLEYLVGKKLEKYPVVPRCGDCPIDSNNGVIYSE